MLANSGWTSGKSKDLFKPLTYYSSPFQPFNHCALFKSFKPSDAQTIRLSIP